MFSPVRSHALLPLTKPGSAFAVEVKIKLNTPMLESYNNEVLKKLFRQTSKVLFVYNVNAGKLEFLNDAFTKVWQRTKESVLANPAILVNTIHPDDTSFLYNEYQDLLHGILKQNVEFRIILPDQRVSWLQLTPHVATDTEGRQYIGGVLDDITVVRDNIRSLEKFAAKKNSILEILSHDLAGPLANIQALADMLSETTEQYNDSEVKEVISIIRESSARSIQLIRDFVQQEFLESSNSGMVKKRVNLVEKVREVIEQYKEGEEHVSKKFILSTSSEKIFAYIDQSKLMQVINNLISNSIKFTHDNGVITTELEEQENRILIVVKDNGVGIPKRYHDELFDKFTRARRPGLRGEPSTGLGMSIIKTIVEWHGGRIWFDSQENKGTTFYIELPK